MPDSEKSTGSPKSPESTLKPGLIGSASVIVSAALTATALGSGSVDVYSTPALVALLEEAAIHALAGHLDEGQTSVGIALNIKHLAATPVGMSVILSQGIRLGKTNAVVGVDSLQLHLSPSC